MTDQRIPLELALRAAEVLRDHLAPACERIEIAGSIRRRKPTVKDIELVAVPKWQPAAGGQYDLFGQCVLGSALDATLDDLNGARFKRADKNGGRYENFVYKLDGAGALWIKVDLFIATPDNYGYILALRTGPADFCRMMVTQRSRGGWLPGHLRFAGGQMWRGAEAIATPDEHTLFREIGIEWLDPVYRLDYAEMILAA